MNTTALAIIQPQELSTIQEAAKVLALSGYFDGKGNTPQAIAQIATKILAGREIGIGPFASVNGIHIISGKPSIGANLLASAVKGSGRYDYRVKEMSNDVCTIEFFEREDGKRVSIGVSTFTKEDATKAGTQNMTKFARNMLFARAMSNGVRWFCPDVFNGNAVYVPEELGAEVDGDGNVIEVEARQVDPEVDSWAQPHEVEDEPVEEIEQGPKVQLASQAQRNKMHALGMEFHGGKTEWDEARIKWVQAASKGAISSSNDLSVAGCDWIIASLEKRISERAAQPVVA